MSGHRDHPGPRTRMDDLTVERVLRTIEAIPPGRVAAYGQIGAIAGVGPRLVGRIVSVWGSGVPWWRVTNASGDHAPPQRSRAFEIWEREGIARKPNGLGCRIQEYGADLVRLRAEAEAAWADLPETEDGREGTSGDAAGTGECIRTADEHPEVPHAERPAGQG